MADGELQPACGAALGHWNCGDTALAVRHLLGIQVSIEDCLPLRRIRSIVGDSIRSDWPDKKARSDASQLVVEYLPNAPSSCANAQGNQSNSMFGTDRVAGTASIVVCDGGGRRIGNSG